MIEITIEKNDAGQRFDRFLKKLLENAPISQIQKGIRKKTFKLNHKKAEAATKISEGDLVELYISDATYEKWKRREDFSPSDFNLNIAYEDENIIIMDKPQGLLTHAAEEKDYGNNLVDYMSSYLYKTGQIKDSRTFRPAVVNRLDRNTAGLIIGGKNAQALRDLNRGVREGKIDSYYLTLVKGEVKGEFEVDRKVAKNSSKNKIMSSEEGFEIKTKFRGLETNGRYSLVECLLITGKTHQIRYSLKSKGYPIIGDPKYGDRGENQKLYNSLGLKGQVLLAYKISFGEIEGLEYLSGREFVSSYIGKIESLKDRLFNGS